MLQDGHKGGISSCASEGTWETNAHDKDDAQHRVAQDERADEDKRDGAEAAPGGLVWVSRDRGMLARVRGTHKMMLATRRTGLNICERGRRVVSVLTAPPRSRTETRRAHHLCLLPEADEEAGAGETEERADGVQERERDRRADEEQDGTDDGEGEAGERAWATGRRACCLSVSGRDARALLGARRDSQAEKLASTEGQGRVSARAEGDSEGAGAGVRRESSPVDCGGASQGKPSASCSRTTGGQGGATHCAAASSAA